MTKYIDREALVEWLKRIPLKDLSDGRGLCRVIMEDDFKKAIKKMPKGIIVDIAPVRHGRWGGDNCTVCKLPWNYNMTQDADDWGYFDPMPDYCPNCGAKMDEVSE